MKLRTPEQVREFVRAFFADYGLPEPKLKFTRKSNAHASAQYDQSTATVTIFGLPVERKTLAHEIFHALQDWAVKTQDIQEQAADIVGEHIDRAARKRR